MKKICAFVVALCAALTASAQADLFSGGHQDVPFGFTVGYVNKTWRTNFGGDKAYHENPWGEDNKRLHGMQFGVTYQPCFDFGLGLHTGAYYELYLSYSDPVKISGYDEFSEHDIYVPLHVMYRVPFSRNCSFMAYGGVAFNWAMAGTYNDFFYGVGYNEVEGFYPETYSVPMAWQRYGKDAGWPHHMNFQCEVGGALRFGWAQVGFTYAFGMTNHHFYEGYKTRQDKININLSIVTDFGMKKK